MGPLAGAHRLQALSLKFDFALPYIHLQESEGLGLKSTIQYKIVKPNNKVV